MNAEENSADCETVVDSRGEQCCETVVDAEENSCCETVVDAEENSAALRLLWIFRGEQLLL